MLAIVAHVLRDLFVAERRPRVVTPGRIADARGEVADQQDHAVAEFDELLQFVQHDRVPEVQQRPSRIDAEFDGQALFSRNAFDEFA